MEMRLVLAAISSYVSVFPRIGGEFEQLGEGQKSFKGHHSSVKRLSSPFCQEKLRISCSKYCILLTKAADTAGYIASERATQFAVAATNYRASRADEMRSDEMSSDEVI